MLKGDFSYLRMNLARLPLLLSVDKMDWYTLVLPMGLALLVREPWLSLSCPSTETKFEFRLFSRPFRMNLELLILVLMFSFLFSLFSSRLSLRVYRLDRLNL